MFCGGRGDVSPALLILIFPFTGLFVVLDSKFITHPLLSRLYGKDT
jgi:hypothetical protein